MTRKERLIEVARDTYGIKNAADMSERQLRKTVAELRVQDPNYVAPNKPKAKKQAPKQTSTVLVAPTAKPEKSTISVGVAKDDSPVLRTHRVHFYQDFIGEWRWRLVADNGNIVADSGEGYATRWGSRRAFKKAIGLR